MTDSKQSKSQIQNRPWAALWSVLLLAPLAMAPKGCDSVVIGDQCPPDKPCTTGSAGSDSMSSAGNAGSKPTGAGGGAAGSKPTGNGGDGAGGAGICGGIVNRACAADEYCLFDAKTAACGAGDQTGVCTPRPQVCPEIYAPVCACDSKTYSSECEAAAKGFSVLHTGTCEDPSSGASCGGLKPSTCAKSEFCNFPIGSQCGSADQTGTCTRIPDVCDDNYAPVCGCDGVTYSTECTANAKGVSVLHTGVCDPPTGTSCGGLIGAPCPKGQACIYPVEAQCGAFDMTGTCSPISDGPCPQNIDLVCGCDGKTYSNTCTANSMGISVASAGACPVAGTGCGGDSTVTCAADEYCDYPTTANCGEADAPGVCTKKTTGACITLYDPVCGCDGKTYGNSCEAGLAAMSIRAKGACP